jgi:hypothetical protein
MPGVPAMLFGCYHITKRSTEECICLLTQCNDGKNAQTPYLLASL